MKLSLTLIAQVTASNYLKCQPAYTAELSDCKIVMGPAFSANCLKSADLKFNDCVNALKIKKK